MGQQGVCWYAPQGFHQCFIVTFCSGTAEFVKSIDSRALVKAPVRRCVYVCAFAASNCCL